MDRFTVTTSVHRTPALELEDASPELHAWFRSLLRCSHMADERYHLVKGCGAFLQGGANSDEGWLLIEFWRADGIPDFMAYVNKHAPVAE